MKQSLLKKSALFIGAMLAGSAQGVIACTDSPYLGSVCITAGSYCPRGYMETTGQLLSIREYSILFSVISNYYGGDGPTTFALPDLRGRTPVGVGQGAGLSRVYQGQSRGIERNILTVNQLPSHTHKASLTPTSASLQASTAAGTQPEPASDRYLGKVTPARGASGVDLYTSDASQLTSIKGLALEGEISVANTGDGQSFYTLPPQLGLRFCIAVEGPYPPRE
jgi:microcystin-dependent protein